MKVSMRPVSLSGAGEFRRHHSVHVPPSIWFPCRGRGLVLCARRLHQQPPVAIPRSVPTEFKPAFAGVMAVGQAHQELPAHALPQVEQPPIAPAAQDVSLHLHVESAQFRER